MRRPSFCCDHHAGSGECQPQGGAGESTLSRVRRFLSMGARTRTSSTSLGIASSSPAQCQKLGTQDPLCQSQAGALHSLLAELKGSGLCVASVLGQSLEDVMDLQGGDTTGNGVPTAVHLLCCFILTHGVDFDTLVSSAWCAEEARTRQVLEQGLDAVEIPPGSECSVATGLLRLFLDSLPHAILPPKAQHTIIAIVHTTDSYVCEDVNSIDENIGVLGEAVIPKLRRLLYRHLPHYSLCLLRYLAAFLHQLRTSNHNTCPVTISSLGLVLSRVLVGPGEAERANRLGQLLILTYSKLFHNNLQFDDTDGYSDSCLSSPGSVGDCSRDGDDDDDGGTTSDTDDFRSPPVSPLKLGHGHNTTITDGHRGPVTTNTGIDNLKHHELNIRSLEDCALKVMGQTGLESAPHNVSKSSHNLALAKAEVSCVGGTQQSLSYDTGQGLDNCGGVDGPRGGGAAPHGSKRKDHEEGKATGEHSPKAACRSSQELLGSIGRFDGVSTKSTPFSRHRGSNDCMTPSDEDAGSTFSEDDEDNTRTTESSCVSAQEYWDTGGESDQPIDDLNTRNLELVANEERLSSDRFLPVRKSAPRSADHRNRRKTKRKHHYPSKHSHHHRDHREQDTNVQSSGEEEVQSYSYLASLTSEDENPPARYEPEPTDACTYQPLGIRNISEPSYSDSLPAYSDSVFSGLVDSNEPVTSNRGSWGMRDAGDSNHHTAPWHRSYEDESSVVSKSWHPSEEDVGLSTHHSGGSSFSEASAGLSPHLDQSPGGGGNAPVPPGQTAVKVMMKNINSIKKKIKHFEEEFETAFGYRPSHSEKMKHKDIKKYMSELSKARKELKQMKDDVTGLVSVSSVFPLSLLRCQESTTPGSRPIISGQSASAGAASTLRQVEERLKEKRSACGRQEDMMEMSSNELQDEKTALQKALLYYEYIHGRPKTREDRDLARPLYDRYRQCKRNVLRTGSRGKDNMGDLDTIVEGETMDFTLASPQHHGSSSVCTDTEDNEDPGDFTTPTTDEESALLSPAGPPEPYITLDKEGEKSRSSIPLGDLHSLPLHELKERKKEAKDEKKSLRRALKDFEEQFERDFGRKVQKEDRGPLEQTYLDYKHSKAKLRLLEALLSKHEPPRY